MNRIVSFIVLCLFSCSSFSWWGLGHMAVADIAYQNLTPSARNKVDQMVVDFQKVYPEVNSFQKMSKWPDALYSQQKIYLYFHWHFIDIPFSADQTPVKKHIFSDNIVKVITQITRSFKDGRVTNGYERARLLALLTHFVGDIHQPLHTVSRFSSAHPDGDRGGNQYVIIDKSKQSNLHKLWDSGFGLYDNDNASQEEIRALTNTITATYPRAYFGERMINELNPDTWTDEGMKNAVNYVYTTPEHKAPSIDYWNMGKKVTSEQVALAGYRLAQMLNQLLT